MERWLTAMGLIFAMLLSWKRVRRGRAPAVFRRPAQVADLVPQPRNLLTIIICHHNIQHDGRPLPSMVPNDKPSLACSVVSLSGHQEAAAARAVSGEHGRTIRGLNSAFSLWCAYSEQIAPELPACDRCSWRLTKPLLPTDALDL